MTVTVTVPPRPFGPPWSSLQDERRAVRRLRALRRQQPAVLRLTRRPTRSDRRGRCDRARLRLGDGDAHWRRPAPVRGRRSVGRSPMPTEQTAMMGTKERAFAPLPSDPRETRRIACPLPIGDQAPGRASASPWGRCALAQDRPAGATGPLHTRIHHPPQKQQRARLRVADGEEERAVDADLERLCVRAPVPAVTDDHRPLPPPPRCRPRPR